MNKAPSQILLNVQEFTRVFKAQLEEIRWQDPEYKRIQKSFDRILAFEDPAAVVVSPGLKPVSRHWEKVLASAGQGRMSNMISILENLTPCLEWLDDPHYRGEDVDREFLENYGCFELVGNQGLVRDDQVTLGCILLSPEIYFPLHAHKGVELLYVVSGRGTWHMDKGPIISIPRGTHILIPSSRMHACWSLGSAPMAAVYICG